MAPVSLPRGSRRARWPARSPADADDEGRDRRALTIVAWAAIIPVGRVLGTPLTLPMLQATGGARSPIPTAARHACEPPADDRDDRERRRVATSTSRLRQTPRRSSAQHHPQRTRPWSMRHADANGIDRSGAELAEKLRFRVTAGSDRSDWRQSPLPSVPSAAVDDLTALHGAAQGRDVVIVSLESTAAQYLSMYGGDDITPTLAALSRRGVVFEHAYAAYPESIKGLFSILCSTFPAFDVNVRVLSRTPCDAIPSVLHRQGYRTALFHSGRFDYLGMADLIRDRGLYIA